MNNCYFFYFSTWGLFSLIIPSTIDTINFLVGREWNRPPYHSNIGASIRIAIE